MLDVGSCLVDNRHVDFRQGLQRVQFNVFRIWSLYWYALLSLLVMYGLDYGNLFMSLLSHY